MRFPKSMLEKHNFPLLFFEHGYLSNRKSCILEILGMHGKHSDLVNCVSEYLFRPWFIFYDKMGNFYPIILHYFSRFHKRKNWALYKKSETQFTRSECFLCVLKTSDIKLL